MKIEDSEKKVILIGVFVTTLCVLIILLLHIYAQAAIISFSVFNFISFVVILISLFAAVIWGDKTLKRNQ
jgi:cobalamin biosynthesis protein CobD/CbiB